MKKSKQLINDLKDAGVITEEFRVMLLVAIEKEKLDAADEIQANFNAIKELLND